MLKLCDRRKIHIHKNIQKITRNLGTSSNNGFCSFLCQLLQLFRTGTFGFIFFISCNSITVPSACICAAFFTIKDESLDTFIKLEREKKICQKTFGREGFFSSSKALCNTHLSILPIPGLIFNVVQTRFYIKL